MQAARLLGLSFDKIILLDNKTKIVSKSQNPQDLLQVSEIKTVRYSRIAVILIIYLTTNIGMLFYIFVYYIIILP